jgi:hypothetical protein
MARGKRSRDVASWRTDQLSNLTAFRAAVAKTATLNTILDDAWFASVEQAIAQYERSVQVDLTGILGDFDHPLRGEPWFEETQELAFTGRKAEIDEGGRFALWFAGLDPLRTMLPKIDERLTAFSRLPFKQDVVRLKLAELRAARNNPSFKNHLFELNILGDLALRGVLVDIEESSTDVDGAIRIDRREILVEATNTAQRVVPLSESHVFSVDANVGIDQVVMKLKKKVTEGRQIAKAAGQPTVLFLARRFLGADRTEAMIALRECFADPQFAPLSGVVLADSYRLYRTSWHAGERPNVPLSKKEKDQLSAWYGQSE